MASASRPSAARPDARGFGRRPGTRLRRLAGNLALVLAGLFAVAAAIEGWARWVVWRWTSLPNPVRAPFAQYDALLGWSKPPGADGWLIRPEYQVHLQINSQGLRGPERAYQKPSGVSRVLLLGDSFTEGYSVDETETVRARLETMLQAPGCPRTEVINGGTSAWGTDQEYLFYLHEGRRYAPDVVALLFYYNDLHGDHFEYVNKPSFGVEGEDDQLVLLDSPVPPPARPSRGNAFRLTSWRGSMALRLLSMRTRGNPALNARLAGLGIVEPLSFEEREAPAELNPFGPRRPREVDRSWRITSALLRELDRQVRSAGSSLVVFYVPARFEIDDDAWRLTGERFHLSLNRWNRDRVFETLREVCGRLGLALVDPRASLRRAEQTSGRTYYPLDGHWTSLGNVVAARELAGRIRTCPIS